MLCIAVAVLWLPAPLAADLDGHYCEQEFDCVQLVDRFLDVFRSGDRSKIVRMVQYPLRRTYPLPYIVDPEQMLVRYDEVFDEAITTLISDSELIDWSDAGWRGIMLQHGVVWLGYDGLLRALNYISDANKPSATGCSAWSGPVSIVVCGRIMTRSLSGSRNTIASEWTLRSARRTSSGGEMNQSPSTGHN